ncbi:MAG: ribonuclease III [Pelagibacterales bacterium]|nr:ribonuclease III [Pelagibacterales bacterium]PPR16387.1 MAG: Ribonuclease 3 [Alphaproteobacteria bacterium MarineAlpha9_Bin3]|tara:strand:+ start:666 stop:1346 length:681 start_codon:yes stop_codon:yes gene_type:complete
MKNLKILESTLSYNFNNIKLLNSAITHTSFFNKNKDYTFERLEFLGDRVLGLVIADLIYKKFLHESEGDLARRIAVLVSGKTLTSIAIKLNLKNYIRVSENLKFINGDSNSILSDSMEAILGAIYLDSNLLEARRVIKLIWKDYMEQDEMPPKDPKSALQELAMELKYEMPVYSDYTKDGPDHSPLFKVKVSIKGVNSSEGKGVSKKSAEISAAYKLLSIIESNEH